MSPQARAAPAGSSLERRDTMSVAAETGAAGSRPAEDFGRLRPGQAGPEGRMKVIVAVHGIGDQTQNETIQAVAYGLCNYCDRPTAIPLGRFRPARDGHVVFSPQSPPDPELPTGLGFAEVYWAEITRQHADKGYSLEEAKRWARTLVDRLRMRSQARPTILVADDYRHIDREIERLIFPGGSGALSVPERETIHLLIQRVIRAELGRTDLVRITMTAANGSELRAYLDGIAGDPRRGGRPLDDDRFRDLQASVNGVIDRRCRQVKGRLLLDRDFRWILTPLKSWWRLNPQAVPSATVAEVIREFEAGLLAAIAAIEGWPRGLSHDVSRAIWQGIAPGRRLPRDVAAEIQRRIDERIRLRTGWGRIDYDSRDYQAICAVLTDMISTAKVIENLLKYGERLGMPPFNLNKVLVSFLGDVQYVADFADVRRSILGRFGAVMEAAVSQFRDGEVYIVAHSEGTVVAFLGLLEALSRPDPPAWAKQVLGLMTIGSPIDKHLALWPELWDDYREGPRSVPLRLEDRIRWRNYNDRGDPVGFELDTARDWLEEHGWDDVFEFEPEHDYVFSRYWFPGQAHNDYWKDPIVFGHFLETVIDRGSGWRVGYPEPDPYEDAPRKDNFWAKVTCGTMPYLLAAGLLFLGVYILYKSVDTYFRGGRADAKPHVVVIPAAPEPPSTPTPAPSLARAGPILGAVGPAAAGALAQAAPRRDGTRRAAQVLRIEPEPAEEVPGPWSVFRNVAGITALLAGMTLLARLPRLSRDKAYCWWVGCALFLAGVLGYEVGVEPGLRFWLIDWSPEISPSFVLAAALGGLCLGKWLRSTLRPGWQNLWLTWAADLAVAIAAGAAFGILDWSSHLSSRIGTDPIPVIAFWVAILAILIVREYPDWGLGPLLWAGGIGVSFIVVGRMVAHAIGKLPVGDLWPVVPGCIAFLYLWWLAALVFDMTFFWHAYIRSSFGIRQIRRLTGCPEDPEAAPRRTRARPGQAHATGRPGDA
jgi:hypothetical protein